MAPIGPIPAEAFEAAKGIKNKRARAVVEHILKHGSINTEQLAKEYGYNHPPRAARDVRELNVELLTTSVKSTDGRWIANYELLSFDGLINKTGNKSGGRRTLPKKFRVKLLLDLGSRCNICFTPFPASALQVDHRVPYEVGGEAAGNLDAKNFQLVCGSCNRAKSWTCEHCENWTALKTPDLCLSCYWGMPEEYSHIALQEMRRVDVTWTDSETKEYDALRQLANKEGSRVPAYVKKTLSVSIKKLR